VNSSVARGIVATIAFLLSCSGFADPIHSLPFTSDRVDAVHVPQKGMTVVHGLDSLDFPRSSVAVMQTTGVASCVCVVLYHPVSKTAVMAHLDAVNGVEMTRNLNILVDLLSVHSSRIPKDQRGSSIHAYTVTGIVEFELYSKVISGLRKQGIETIHEYYDKPTSRITNSVEVAFDADTGAISQFRVDLKARARAGVPRRAVDLNDLLLDAGRTNLKLVLPPPRLPQSEPSAPTCKQSFEEGPPRSEDHDPARD
jgi:hypothetical protein